MLAKIFWANRSLAHFLWATWANRSWSLICLERPERFAHGRSFPLSDLSDLLTVAHLSWAIWANCSQPLLWFERNEQMSEWANEWWAMSEWANSQPCSKLKRCADLVNPEFYHLHYYLCMFDSSSYLLGTIFLCKRADKFRIQSVFSQWFMLPCIFWSRRKWMICFCLFTCHIMSYFFEFLRCWRSKARLSFCFV